MDDILGLGPGPARGDAARVKAWVREARRLGEDAVIMVSELRCHEAGCPDVETVIAVMGDAGEDARTKLAKPVAAITRADIAAWR